MVAPSFWQKVGELTSSPALTRTNQLQKVRKRFDGPSSERSRSRDSAQSTPASLTKITMPRRRLKKLFSLPMITNWSTGDDFSIVQRAADGHGHHDYRWKPDPELFIASQQGPAKHLPPVPAKERSVMMHGNAAPIEVTTSTVTCAETKGSLSDMEERAEHLQSGRCDGNADIAKVAVTTTERVNSDINTPSTQLTAPFQGGKDQLKQAQELIDHLQEELRKAKQELIQRDKDIRVLLDKDETSVSKLAELDAALETAEQKLIEQAHTYNEQMTAKSEMIERLRIKATEAASKAAEAPLDQPGLRLPEREIINMWAELGYKVHNFVLCYLKDLSALKIENWTELQGHNLREVSPHYSQLAANKKAGTWFMEAAMWSAITRLVFASSTTHGNVCWAGKYGTKLERLSAANVNHTAPLLPTAVY